MFDLPGDKLIKAQRERLKDQMLGSYKNPQTLVKGLTPEEFNSNYPETKFERYSFESLSKAKDELKKGENFDEQAFDLETSKMKPVVVEHEGKKKLMYVREKIEKGEDLEKGGEGSRGGKIIGHTSSGKPIYDTATHESHKDFTKQDHLDAAKINRTKSDEHEGKMKDIYSKTKSKFTQAGEKESERASKYLNNSFAHKKSAEDTKD